MKNNLIIIILLLSTTFMFSFDYDEQSTELIDFLIKNFNYQLSDSITKVVVINLEDCSSCVTNNLKTLSQSNLNKNSIIVILVFSGRFIDDKYKKYINDYFCLYDNKKAFSRSKFGSLKTVIFSINNKIITKIIKVKNHEDIKSMG